MQKQLHPIKERAAFTSLQKGRALLVLLDYSDRTGKKWSAICSEIMSLVGKSATSQAPLLTRQDLEAWASGRSQLGDEKFSYVFDFLTHPETLERPEFSNTYSFLADERLKSLASALKRSVGEDNHEAVFMEESDRSDFVFTANDFDGLYLGETNSQQQLLYLSFEQSLGAYLCHLFLSPQGSPDDWIKEMERKTGIARDDGIVIGGNYAAESQDFLKESDWSIIRYSGVGIFGNPIRIFLRGVEERRLKNLTLHTSIHKILPVGIPLSKQSARSFWIVDQAVSSTIAEKFAEASSFQQPDMTELVLDLTNFISKVEPRFFTALDDFFSDLRWNVDL